MNGITGFLKDGIKESTKKFVGRWIDTKKWEAIFVESGNAVAEFENYYDDEQSEIRSIVFGRDNMIQLADWLKNKDFFEIRKNLENGLDSLLKPSGLSKENKENCKQHFIDIMIKEIKEQFPFMFERCLDQETHDIVQQQGMFLRENNNMLQKILSAIQSEKPEAINYQSKNIRRGKPVTRGKREKFVQDLLTRL